MSYNPQPLAPTMSPAPAKGGAGKKIILVLVLLIATVVIGGFVAVALYYYIRRINYKPLPVAGTCNNGSISVPRGTLVDGKPVSPPDGVSCLAQWGYNTYPTAKVSTPSLDGAVVFGPSATYSDGSPMTGFLCTQACNDTEGCVTAECKTISNGDSCVCTGYNIIPTSLASDAGSSDCDKKNECTSVYVLTNAISR